ncbi:MAG: DnaB-like helicase C-terminal domain-containing protein [Candidatus Kapaibacterium sp.]
MKDITAWITYDLYPALFERIDAAFPEHNFERFSGGWRSQTYLSGQPHKSRRDKTVVTTNHPGRILEQGGDNLSLIDYVIMRDGVEFIEAARQLSDIAGLDLPGDRAFDAEAYARYRNRAEVLEDLNEYFKYLLCEKPEGGDDRRKVLEYLSGRGYSDEDIRTMELGYCPPQSRINSYLDKKIEKGVFAPEVVAEALAMLNKSIGNTHILSIPYRSGGQIKGFKFRTINPDISPKYMNTTGMDKSGGFFNLAGISGDKDIVIVEGELDALHASAKGIPNVVASGGKSVHPAQISDAIRRGAKSFTICPDREPGKESQTYSDVYRVIQVILSYSVSRVYVVNLPDISPEKTDPDSLIKERGAEAFAGAIRNAVPYYEYILKHIIAKYRQLEQIEGAMSARRIDDFLAEIVSAAVAIPEPTHNDIFRHLLTADPLIARLGITKESIAETIDKIAASREKERHSAELRELLAKAESRRNAGDTASALEILETETRRIKISARATEFDKLKHIPTEADVRAYFAQSEEGLYSGYRLRGQELLLPSGALTGIAGATGHGKTDFLINLALNAADRYPDKEFYFFTYEMSEESILIRFLNTFLNEELNAGSNHRTIKSYFKTGSTQYIYKDSAKYFLRRKDEFFDRLIAPGRLRLKAVDYTAPELILALRRLAESGKVGGFFIDYFQLLNLPKEGYKNYSRQEELKVICQDLNKAAKDLRLPLILAVQFNREVTTPFRMHPTKIGEAGDIERILDTLIGIWNTNKNCVDKDLTKSEESDMNSKSLRLPDRLFVQILKSRETASGLSELLLYNGKKGVIENESDEEPTF